MRGLRLVTIGLLLLVAGTACGGALFRQPVVTLESVQLAGLGLRGGTLMVNVEIQNPNAFALNASQVRYEVAIADVDAPSDTAWVELANGVYQEQISVGGGQSATIQVPVEFTYSGLGSAASSILRAGMFVYRAAGAVDVRTPLGAREVPFRHRGAVSLIESR